MLLLLVSLVLTVLTLIIRCVPSSCTVVGFLTVFLYGVVLHTNQIVLLQGNSQGERSLSRLVAENRMCASLSSALMCCKAMWLSCDKCDNGDILPSSAV